MRKTKQGLGPALAGLLVACSGGGGPTGNSGSGDGSSAWLELALLAHSPADGAVQVPLDATIVVEFDSMVVADSLQDDDTWLRIAGTTQNISGTFDALGNGSVRFQPAATLLPETDYVFQVGGLTCDNTGRILDTQRSFTFRTLDATPPTLNSIDVADNATDVSRTRAFTLVFSEAIDPDSVTATTLYLRDSFGTRYACRRTLTREQVVLQPLADLPGNRQFFLVVGSPVSDRAGNRLGDTSTTRFRTAADAAGPSLVSIWPVAQTGVSPAVQPTVEFDESMDPASVEAASLMFEDEFGSLVPFAVHASEDQRHLRIRPLAPLQPDREYTLAFLTGSAGATDVSGNPLTDTDALVFRTGVDATAPTVVTSSPADGERRVSVNTILQVTFSKALDPTWLGTETVQLEVDGATTTCVVDQPTPGVVRVRPLEWLPAGADCRLVCRGGHEGLRDLAGNVLAADRVVAFTAAEDDDVPNLMQWPGDGSTNVPADATVTIVFDGPMDPATLTSATVTLETDAGAPVGCTLEVRGANRVVRIVPLAPLQQFEWYRYRVRGGATGVREPSGNALGTDRVGRFRVGTFEDNTAPTVRATLNGIDASRTSRLVLPPSGFTVDVTATDGVGVGADMGRVTILLVGPVGTLDDSFTYRYAEVGQGTLRARVPADNRLGAGLWTLTVQVPDLCGNVGASTELTFTVAEATGDSLPFERMQVVWVRTDMDRNGGSAPDFDEDLVRLGLGSATDPAGTNRRMRELLLDGILAKANSLYHRGRRGEPLGPDSVPLRFTRNQPRGLTHMQIALGGLDPEGNRRRAYGAGTTGVLGRAYYDHRNGNFAERNTATSPGLGVFPAEMWLYQTDIHIQVWPSYQTMFAQRFRPLCPDMGGTPAGEHPLDAVVLAEGFDPDTASSVQRARWNTVMNAVDDWASVIGVILAHETGHSIGLTAPGPAPNGLFGDSSLHDANAGSTEVMAPSVGYEAMATLDYHFRDIDLAYLRQRILLR